MATVFQTRQCSSAGPRSCPTPSPSRCQLFVQPAGRLQAQYAASSTCVAWKEQVHHSSEVRSLLQCPAVDSSFLPLMLSALAVPDDLRHIASHGEEDWDPAYIIHLHPVATLRNLLPYTLRYLLEVCSTHPRPPCESCSDLSYSNRFKTWYSAQRAPEDP